MLGFELYLHTPHPSFDGPPAETLAKALRAIADRVEQGEGGFRQVRLIDDSGVGFGYFGATMADAD